MTNADKYLKDAISGNDIFNLSQALGEYLTIKCRAKNVFVSDINTFFALKLETTPTLTEDERVILRNIDENNYVAIGRKNDELYLRYTGYYFHREIDDTTTFALCFPNLFQFIKERRRI